MDITTLPECACGQIDWKQGGGSFGPSINQIGFLCKACQRKAVFTSNAKNNILLIFTEEQELSKTINSWLNEVLLATWRDYDQRLAAARKPVEDRWYNYAIAEFQLPEGATFNDVPKEKRKLWQNFWSLLSEYDAYKNPAEVSQIMIPGRLPLEILAYVLKDNIWHKVSHEESARVIVPADPIRVQHDTFYNEVFKEIEQILDYKITFEYVTNEYCGATNEPWFNFMLGSNRIIMGPRKRVTAIKLAANRQEFNTAALRQAAIKVNNTYYANGSWQGEEATVKNLEVHAWNKEQLINFLTIIGKESLGVPVS